jgi:predicted Zn-dependent peptidase
MPRVIPIAICFVFVILAFPAYSGEYKIVPDHQRFSLGNGLQVILIEDNRLPLIDVRMMIKVGSSSDSASLSGLASITFEMLKEGTRKYPGEDLVGAIDSTGGMIEAISSRESSVYYGSFLSRDVDFAIEVFAEMMQHPEFSEDSFDRLRQRYISAIMQINSIAERRLENALFRSIYEDGSFGLPVNGTLSGMRKITIDDVRRFYDMNFHPDNSALIMAGDFSSKRVKKAVKRNFSNWTGGKQFTKPIARPKVSDSMRIIILDSPEAPSTEFIIGRSGVPLSSDEFAPLVLLNYILGGAGEISRLSQALLQENRFATTINSKLHWSRGPGVLSISGATTNDMAGEAIREVLNVMDELVNIRVPERELKEARNFFRGFLPGRFENTYGTTNIISEFLRNEVELDFFDNLLTAIDEVDPNMLRRTAKEFLNKNHLFIIVSGPENSLRRSLSDLGSIRVMDSGGN